MTKPETLAAAASHMRQAAALLRPEMQTAGAVEARALLEILGRLHRLTDDVGQLGADVAADAARLATVADLRARAVIIKAATDPAQLADLARDAMGLESVDHADDDGAGATIEEARAALLAGLLDECERMGIDPAAVM